MHGGIELVPRKEEIEDTDKEKGTIVEITARAKRRPGEESAMIPKNTNSTNINTRIHGLAQQMEATAQKTLGIAKNAGRVARDEARSKQGKSSAEGC